MFIAFLILPFSCERDEPIDIATKAKFNAPSISQAKQHVEQRTTLNIKSTDNFLQNRDLEGGLTVDWELSGVKKYKDEPDQQVDILYTPIYINNDAQAKMFIGSVEYNGEIKSNIFCLIYTDLENTTTFSGYFLRFDLDGMLLSALKYNNGMIVQPENNNSGALGRSNNSDCTDFATMLQCLQDYFGGDLDMSFWHLGGLIDTVVTATSIDAGDSAGGGSGLVTALPPSIYIPPADIDNNNTGGGIGLPFWSLNYVTANGFNISQWLKIHPLTPIAQWLINEATNDQLQQIANFLNAHRYKIRDQYPLLNVDGSDGFEPADSPTASTGYGIDEDASDFILIAIEAIANGGEVDFEEQVITTFSEKTQCVYNKLVRSGLQNHNLIRDTFLHFGNNSFSGANLIYQEQANLTNTNGELLLGSFHRIGNNYYITINSSQLDNRSPIEIAQTILHESVHALLRLHYNISQQSFIDLFSQYMMESTGSNNITHNIMRDNYVLAIANTLEQFDNAQEDFSFYESLAWEGLQDFLTQQEIDAFLLAQQTARNRGLNCN